MNSNFHKIKLLGKLIEEARKAQDISQSELAELAGHGLYRQLVGRIEQGKQPPTVLQAEAISEVLSSCHNNSLLTIWRERCAPFSDPVL